MGAFSLNTNISSMNAQRINRETNRDLTGSMEKLASGLRITKAADDGSGETISNSLRKQSSAIGQSIKNANDAVAIIQIADKAMDEQLKILDTIKVKATQAAQNGQTKETREAIQSDIQKLLNSLDDVAMNTSFNSQSLLSGSFTNKTFQVGGYSQQDITMTINSTLSTKVGSTRFETVTLVSGISDMTFNRVDGVNNIDLESVTIGSLEVGTGVKALADVINKNSDNLKNIRAGWTNRATASVAVTTNASIEGLKVNNITIGNISGIGTNDNDGKLVNAINEVKDLTGVEAYTDESGALNLRSLDGRGIRVSATSGLNSVGFANDTSLTDFGRLTLKRNGATDINFSDANNVTTTNPVAGTVMNLSDVNGALTADQTSAIGGFANANEANANGLGIGVTTLAGAMAMMDIADSAIMELDKIRSNIGSYQNSFISTINNISVTKVNVDSARSQLKDLDFAEESAFFNKKQLLTQSGSYALSQANQIPANVQKLLS